MWRSCDHHVVTVYQFFITLIAKNAFDFMCLVAAEFRRLIRSVVAETTGDLVSLLVDT
tara:strand:+ start:886 stop:1059 length:174 start_codon:yes stop_codon:yes gene_type:complete